MQRLKLFFCLVLGFSIGWFAREGASLNKIGNEKSNAYSDQAKTNLANSKENLEKIDSGNTQVSTCPPKAECPCLLSDQILPPPSFRDDMPALPTTNNAGELKLRWNKVAGAKGYEIFVESEAVVLKTYKTSRDIIYLKDLPLPQGARLAHYKIRLATANAKDEIGEKSPPKLIQVRARSTIVAPKIEEIRVED